MNYKKRLQKYYTIYQELWENPFIRVTEISENTGIPQSSVSRYLSQMYKLSILKGPQIFLKPARNYHEYAAFLRFENPLLTYERFEGFPHVIFRNVGFGKWNISLICDRLLDFSALNGFEAYVALGAKGATVCSQVTSLDWDLCMKRIRAALSPPQKESFLYDKIPLIPWNEKEWALYHRFQSNIRGKVMPALQESDTYFQRYQKWILKLPEVAAIQPRFYPHGIDNYLSVDFLFESSYQKQLVNILGMLPSTSVFFSVGKYVLARLSSSNAQEKNDLFFLIYKLKARKFFTEVYEAFFFPRDFRNDQVLSC